MGIVEAVPADAQSESSNVPAAREPKGYLHSLSFAQFGIMLALMAPVMVTMALKIKRIAPEGQADSALGLVLGVGAFLALIANPLAGRLSDRTMAKSGMRKPWIFAGVLGGFMSMLIIGFASNVPTVLIGWALAQMFFNFALAAIAGTLPDQVPVNRRGAVSGVIGMVTPLAILMGSVVANALTSDVLRFLIPGLVALLFGTYFCFKLEDRKLAEKPAEKLSLVQLFGSFVFNPRKHPDFGWVWLTKFLMMFGYAGVATYLPYYLMDKFGMDEKGVTGFVVTVNLLMVGGMILSSPLGGMLSDKFKVRRPFVSGAGLIMGVGLVIMGLAPSTGLMLVAAAIIGLGAGCFFSVDQALAMDTLPNPDNNAKDLGVLNMANALPQSIAPTIAPAIIALGNTTALGGYTVWYLFGAAIAITGAILVMRIKGVK